MNRQTYVIELDSQPSTRYTLKHGETVLFRAGYLKDIWGFASSTLNMSWKEFDGIPVLALPGRTGINVGYYTLKKVTEQDTHYELRSGGGVVFSSCELVKVRQFALQNLGISLDDFEKIPVIYSCIGTKREPQKLELPWQSSGGIIERVLESVMCLTTLVALGDVLVEEITPGIHIGTKYQCMYCKFNHSCLNFLQRSK